MKKLFFILSVVLFFLVTLSTAQITFQKIIGGTSNEKCYSVQQTSDGGYIIAGTTASIGAGSYDAYLIKTDINGDTLWTRTFGWLVYDELFSVQQTTDGGYIMTGWANGLGVGSNDAYLIKTNANGDSLWVKTFGGTNTDYGNYIQQTSDGGFIITGGVNSFGAGGSDIYLIKTDAHGDSLWIRTYGGIDNDYGTSVQQTSDNGYIITGRTLSFGSASNDLYLIKTDDYGNLIWSKTFGSAGSDYGNSVRQTSDGGYIITGGANGFVAGGSDVYLIKTDINGDTLWTKTIGGVGNDYGNSVQQTSDEGYIITGLSNSFGSGNDDVYLIKTDVNGNLIWTKTFGGTNNDEGYSVQQTSDGGYIITGYSQDNAGYYDVFLIKTDSTGNSGCNQGNPPIIVTTIATQVVNPVSIVNTTNSVVTNPVTAVSSGGIVTLLCLNAGLNETTNNNSILVSPNPSSGIFTISCSDNFINGDIEIYSTLGNIIYSDRIRNNSKKEINLLNISAGIYFVRLNDNEKYYSKRIIIEQ